MTQPIDRVFVIHVSEGYEERKKHIDSHLPKSGITKFEYMLDGDIKDLTDEVTDKLFKGASLSLAEKSCFYKHYLVYKKIVEDKIPQCLVLEDDAYLAKGFCEKITQVCDELSEKSNYLVNIESAYLSVPFKYREKGRYTYRANYTKMTGGYVIDFLSAKKIYEYLNENPSQLPIDTYQSEMRDKIGFNIYWSHPSLVEQGSKNGTFASGINGEGDAIIDKLKYLVKNYHKKYIFSHFNKRVLRVFEDVPFYK
ncbi:glycosyltransferase family 25 protein [Vibrio japonicus]|uniref:Glycosyltransferase family 25 protein n=1 Tax=Vibrio japonicus TaxID=1824638 RepID=A0ABY5LHR0_9VIBR|nr:glycosyltransferase family 25 protein [Vibrio japonicus]UUM30486.1 glycosyltransferase family 25 protein [Vibrio japonicus]